MNAFWLYVYLLVGTLYGKITKPFRTPTASVFRFFMNFRCSHTIAFCLYYTQLKNHVLSWTLTASVFRLFSCILGIDTSSHTIAFCLYYTQLKSKHTFGHWQLLYLDSWCNLGIDTSSHTIAFCLYYLAKNPAVQEKLAQEVKDKVQSSTPYWIFSTICRYETYYKEDLLFLLNWRFKCTFFQKTAADICLHDKKVKNASQG